MAVFPRKEILFSTKNMNLQAMRRYRRNLSAYYYVKQVNWKRLHYVSFQGYVIMGRAKLWIHYGSVERSVVATS